MLIGLVPYFDRRAPVRRKNIFRLGQQKRSALVTGAAHFKCAAHGSSFDQHPSCQLYGYQAIGNGHPIPVREDDRAGNVRESLHRTLSGFGPFAKIAVDTSQREIANVVATVVLDRNNMFNMQSGKRRIFLPKLQYSQRLFARARTKLRVALFTF